MSSVSLTFRTLQSAIARRWQRKGFARHATSLAASAAVAQVGVFLTYPLLTRMYSPADFGLLGAYMALFQPMMVFVLGKLEQAVPLPEEEDKAANIAALALVIGLVFSSLTGYAVFFAGQQLAALVGVPELYPYLWVLPLNLLTYCVFATANAWAVRRKHFSSIAQARIHQTFGQVAIQAVFGALQMKPGGLLAGSTLAFVTAASVFLKKSWREDRLLLKKISSARVLAALREYYRFPCIAAPSAVLNVMATALPSLLVTSVFGPTKAGFYLLSQMISFWPVKLIGSAVGDVYYSELARLRDRPAARKRRYMQLSLCLAGFSLCMGVVLLSAPLWAEQFFGEGWGEVGSMLALLWPALFGRVVVSPLSQTYYVCDRQHVLFALDLLRVVLVVAAFLGAPACGAGLTMTVLLFSMAMTFVYVLHWLAMWSMMGEIWPAEKKGTAELG